MRIKFLQDYPPQNMMIFRSVSFLLCLCLCLLAMTMAMADERSTNDESSRALQDQAVALDPEALNWQLKLKGKLPKFDKGFNSDRRLSSKAGFSKSSKCSAGNGDKDKDSKHKDSKDKDSKDKDSKHKDCP